LLIYFVGGAILLSVIIFGVKYSEYITGTTASISWSFGMSVAAGVIALIGGGLLIADNSKSS